MLTPPVSVLRFIRKPSGVSLFAYPSSNAKTAPQHPPRNGSTLFLFPNHLSDLRIFLLIFIREAVPFNDAFDSDMPVKRYRVTALVEEMPMTGED